MVSGGGHWDDCFVRHLTGTCFFFVVVVDVVIVCAILNTALLVETGMVLLTKDGLQGGVSTPAAALGSDLMQQILKEMEASFEIQEVDEGSP
jgi:hypothetical protein